MNRLENQEKSRGLEAFRSSLVVKQVPIELWLPIFSYVHGNPSSKTYSLVENEAKKISCVCKSWWTLSRKFVCLSFRGCPGFSIWVLSHFEDIELLDLSSSIRTIVTDDNLMRLTNLTSLNISQCPMISRRSILNLPHLRELSFSTRDKILYSGLVYLTNLTHLNVQLFEGTYMDNDGKTQFVEHDIELAFDFLYAAFSSLVNLESLHFRGSDICFFKLETLSELPRFKSLQFIGVNTHIYTHQLHLLTGLKSLHVQKTHIGDEDIRDLTQLTSLEFVNESITNDSFCNFEYLTHLKAGIFGTNDAVKDIISLKSLILSVQDDITDEGLKCLTNLTHLEVNPSITDEGLKNLNLLTSLSLNINQNITDFGIMQLSNLTYLDIGENEQVSAFSVQKLSNLKTLKKLRT